MPSLRPEDGGTYLSLEFEVQGLGSRVVSFQGFGLQSGFLSPNPKDATSDIIMKGTKSAQNGIGGGAVPLCLGSTPFVKGPLHIQV